MGYQCEILLSGNKLCVRLVGQKKTSVQGVRVGIIKTCCIMEIITQFVWKIVLPLSKLSSLTTCAKHALASAAC